MILRIALAAVLVPLGVYLTACMVYGLIADWNHTVKLARRIWNEDDKEPKP